MILKFFLSTLFLLLASAESEDRKVRSNICPEQRMQSSQDILCCDLIDGKSCQETMDALLAPQQMDLLKNIAQVSFLDQEASVQNCYRTALEMNGITPSDPSITLAAIDLEADLKIHYIEVSMDTLQPQDLILFEERGKYRFWKEDMTKLNGKSFYWGERTALVHASTYLGHGLIAQKENHVSAVVSLSTLQRSFDFYSQSMKAFIDRQYYVEKRTELYMRAFRKK